MLWTLESGSVESNAKQTAEWMHATVLIETKSFHLCTDESNRGIAWWLAHHALEPCGTPKNSSLIARVARSCFTRLSLHWSPENNQIKVILYDMLLCYMTHIWYSYLRSSLFKLRNPSVLISNQLCQCEAVSISDRSGEAVLKCCKLNSKRDDKGIDAARGAEGRFTACLYLYTMVGGCIHKVCSSIG